MSTAYRYGLKLAFNRSVVFRRQLGPHTFHVEYPKGFEVDGINSRFDYGYLPGVKGPDGDSLDFYVGNDPKGVIARFTKQRLGEGGETVDEDQKYFAGVSRKELDDYVKNFAIQTRQPGVSLGKERTYRDWTDLGSDLAHHEPTGPLTHLQEWWAAKRAPLRVE